MKTVKIPASSFVELETLRLLLLKRNIELNKSSAVAYAIRAMLKKLTTEGKRDELNT